MMRCSVVIPARNSARTLERTLDALIEAERSPDEVLVVDGCSDDRTAFIARSRGARVVPNPRRHVAAARQLGVTNACHEIIAFTDSDCIPAPDWLRRITDRFASGERIDGVGGRVVLTSPRNAIQAYSAQVFETIMRFPTEEVLVTRKGMAGSFAGANCAYRREAIVDVGGFRAEFTNHAEEIDLFWRLIDRGATLLFDPAIKVEHLEYPDTLVRLMGTNFNYGIASTKLAKHHIGSQIDVALYRTWLGSFAASLNPLRRDPAAPLRCLQIGTFITGKIFASIVLRTVNL